MGADLCGIIIVGPKKLDSKRIARAKKNYKALKKDLKKAIQHTITGNTLIAEDVTPRLDRALANLEGYYSETEDALDAINEEDPALVDKIVDIWQNNPYRDQMGRPLPGCLRRGWQIVVAGKCTWGDPPEEDSAQHVLERADMLGILIDLGLM